MKEIIRDDKKVYELKEQDLIRLHTRLRLIYECVDDIFTDYEDFDPSTIAALTDIKNQVTEARDILAVDASAECRVDIKSKHPNCNVKANIFGYKVEMSEEDWQKIKAGAIDDSVEPNKYSVEERLETVKSSLEDAISDVDCTLSDRIDELDEKLGEVYEFYDNFPSDWTLEKQLKELAEETVKAAIEPIMKRQTLLKMDIDSLRNDLKLWVSNDERTSAETGDRLSNLEKKVIVFTANNTTLDRHEEEIDQIASRLSKLDMDMMQRIEENRAHSAVCEDLNEQLKLLSSKIGNIYDEVTSIKDNTTTALEADNATLERHEKEISQLEKELNGINAVQGGHRLELDGLNRKLDRIRVDVNKNKRELTEHMSVTLEETTDESVEDRLSKLEKAFDVMSAVCPKYHK